MRYLVVFLIIFAVVALYVYLRLRPYIRAARQIFGATRGSVHLGRQQGREDLPRRTAETPVEKLVRCASCDTWLPVSRAIAMGRAGTYFCSHECMERAADDPARTRKSAS